MAHLLWPLALLAAGAGQTSPPAPRLLAPQLPAAEAVADDPSAATVALTNVDDRMTVPVHIARTGPYRFVIDTGAERTVISRSVASLLKLPQGRPVNLTAMSGTSRVATVAIPSLKMSAIGEKSVSDAPVLETQNLGAAGLLGIDTLQDHKVVIDFDADTMAVTPSRKRAKTERRLPGEIVVRARNLMGQLIITDAQFDGRPIRVIIDTGSPISIGNSAMRRLVARHSSRAQDMTMTSVTGGVVQTKYATVDNIRIGGVTLSDLPIAFADVPPFRRFGVGDRPALLLGMTTMKVFRRVQIDFANRELRFLLPRADRVRQACRMRIGSLCSA